MPRHPDRTRPWTDAERQDLLDLLRSGNGVEKTARQLQRAPDDCRIEAERLRRLGWTATGAPRRTYANGQPAAPPRRCSACRTPFVPASRFIFRCDPCKERHARIAA